MPLSIGETNNFLSKVASFVKLALDEVDTLQESTLAFRKKEATETLKREKYAQSLRKVADALYEADFLTDEVERKQFLKKAEEDPAYLSSVLIKVCNAADVALVGSPARVAIKKTGSNFYDPVEARAFGFDLSDPNSILQDV